MVRAVLWFTVGLFVSAGCAAPPGPKGYTSEKEGFCFVPPAGWSERWWPASLPVPPRQERLLVRYKRLTAGKPAWLHVSVALLPASDDPADFVAAQSPGEGWSPQGEVEKLQINGLPAARRIFAGRWHRHDFIEEVVAVHKDRRVFCFTAKVLASDHAARRQVREAVASAVWTH